MVPTVLLPLHCDVNYMFPDDNNAECPLHFTYFFFSFSDGHKQIHRHARNICSERERKGERGREKDGKSQSEQVLCIEYDLKYFYQLLFDCCLNVLIDLNMKLIYQFVMSAMLDFCMRRLDKQRKSSFGSPCI